MITVQALQRKFESLKGVIDLIGVSVNYSVSELLLDREVIFRAAERYLGHDLANLLPTKTEKACVSRAVKEAAKKNGRFHDRLARKVVDGADRAVYGLIEEEQNANGSETNTYRQESSLRLNKDDKSVTATGESAEKLMQLYEQYSTHLTDDDVRGYIKRVIRFVGGLPKNPHGHEYMIPIGRAYVVDGIDAFLRDLNCGRTYPTALVNDEITLANTWEAAKRAIQKEIEVIMKTAGNVTKKPSGLRNRQTKLAELKDLAKVYGGLTQASADAEELAELIGTQADRVAEQIAEIQQSKK